MKKLLFITCLLLISFTVTGQGTKILRGPIQMVYGGDTLNLYFDADTVLFDANNGYFEFDGEIKIDLINIKGQKVDSTISF